jgi:hypothetical protein
MDFSSGMISLGTGSRTFRIVACLSSILLFICLAVDSGWGAPRVLVLNESGGEIKGKLNSIRGESVMLSQGSFNLKFSLDAVDLIQFTNLEEMATPRKQSVLVLRDGRVVPFRRLLRTSDNSLTILNEDRTKKKHAFESIKSIHFGELIEQYRILYRDESGESVSIVYRPESSFFRSGRKRWTAKKEEEGFRCSLISSDDLDTQPVTLWELPPNTEKQWSLHRGTGTGEWSSESGINYDPEDFSTRTFPFRFHFPSAGQDVTVRGEFSARLLLPVKFTIENEDSRTWTISRYPDVMTFEPCFLYAFLPEKIFLDRSTGDTMVR